MLQRKGRLLDAVSRSFRASSHRLSEGEDARFRRLQGIRSDLAALILRRPEGMDDDTYTDEVKRLRALSRNLESKLAKHRVYTGADLWMMAAPTTVERVRPGIPPDAALVEFVLYRPFHPRARTDAEVWGEPRYVAYALRREGPPAWVDLGSAADLDGRIQEFRRALSDPGRSDVRAPARRLDEAVLGPVRALVGDARRLFVAPDGALNLVPLGALVDEQGRFLVERYRLHYLASGRDVIRAWISLNTPQPPLVVADPDFEQAGETPPAAPPSGLSRDMGAMRFQRLPGTAAEGRMLGELLRVEPLVRAGAAEPALKEVRSPVILHLATHGFFLDDPPRAVLGERGLQYEGTPSPARRTAAAENPLLRSGVALAGANRRHSGDDDGILTALEMASLDLSATRLAVLSACQTGVGEVRNGEGVYGLRRALAIAGAQTQVISLWRVHDEATRVLMVAFYRRLMAGEGRTEALQNTQLEMLRSERWSHPFYWASFIVSGNWRPLGKLPARQPGSGGPGAGK
ncbi:MAG: CHAT domain-containing protein [Planctomycetota bacterium]